jgi:hypothetical protein
MPALPFDSPQQPGDGGGVADAGDPRFGWVGWHFGYGLKPPQSLWCQNKQTLFKT